MRKFKCRCTNGKDIIGTYLGLQIVPQIKFERNDLEYTLRQDDQLVIIYMDESGCIWTDPIDSGDQIEFV